MDEAFLNPETFDKSPLALRFRGFLPVVVDMETGGFNSETDGILEIAATIIDMDEDGNLILGPTYDYQVEPFQGANLERSALEFTGIDPDDPNRQAEEEEEVLKQLFNHVRHAIKEHGCSRAVLVGHNAHFDHGFLRAAVERQGIKRDPFHPFSCFDTATLSGLTLGHTVLAKSCKLAGIEFSNSQAHSAKYDTIKTAELFCWIVNRWKDLGGWDSERHLPNLD